MVWGVILLIRANTCPTLLLFAEDKLLCLLSLSKRVLSLSFYPWWEEHLPYLSFTMPVSDLCGKREKDKNCKVNSDGITPERIGIFMPFYIWRTHFFPLEKNAIKNFIKLYKFKFFKPQKKAGKNHQIKRISMKTYSQNSGNFWRLLLTLWVIFQYSKMSKEMKN